ncbi:DMT family transporter [Dongia sp.]|uniref:DMT family transporter n=1 Tax=Dongia sp. TaxID=1977262 RepID=UPI0037536A5D
MSNSSACLASQAATPRGSGLAAFVLGGVLLGTIGVFVAGAGTDAVTTTWFRCAFGLIGLTVWMIARRRRRALLPGRRDMPWVVAAAVLMVAAWGLFFFAIARTSTGVAVVLFHLQPLWVLVLSAAWLRERIGARQIGAVSAAIVGLVLAAGVLEHSGSAAGSGYGLGIAACLVGACCTAGVTVIARQLGTLPIGQLAWWQCAIGTLALAPWPVQAGWPAWGLSWAWLAGLGLIHTGLAYALIYEGTARLAAGRIAVLQFIYPAVAILIDWWYFGQTLSVAQLAGIAVIVVAIGFAERR